MPVSTFLTRFLKKTRTGCLLPLFNTIQLCAGHLLLWAANLHILTSFWIRPGESVSRLLSPLYWGAHALVSQYSLLAIQEGGQVPGSTGQHCHISPRQQLVQILVCFLGLVCCYPGCSAALTTLCVSHILPIECLLLTLCQLGSANQDPKNTQQPRGNSHCGMRYGKVAKKNQTCTVQKSHFNRGYHFLVCPGCCYSKGKWRSPDFLLTDEKCLMGCVQSSGTSILLVLFPRLFRVYIFTTERVCNHVWSNCSTCI